MIRIIDGKSISNKILEEESIEISRLSFKPKLAVISVGNDLASKVYIRNKRKACETVGIDFEEIHIDNKNMSSEELFEKLKSIAMELNSNSDVDGILVQKPIIGLSKQCEEQLFLDINPNKDVDVFNIENEAQIYKGNHSLLPCTPQGILTLLDEYKISVEGKNAVVIGRSDIVGKPMALALLNRNANVTICHSKTNIDDLRNYTSNANIIVSAVGKPKFIDSSFISSNCECIIDVGMNRDENGKLCGDINYDDISGYIATLDKDVFITPVPGGVGPMTVASLIQNLIKLSIKRRANNILYIQDTPDSISRHFYNLGNKLYVLHFK